MPVPIAPPPPRADLEQARLVADAVLYEGYVLYPYRASAPKNLLRWQFGVLVPPAFGAEPSWQRTECLIERPGDDRPGVLQLTVRFLQLQQRTVSEPDRGDPGRRRPVASLRVDGLDVPPFDEAVEQEVVATIALDRLRPGRPWTVPVTVAAAEEDRPVVDDRGQRGWITRRRWEQEGVVRVEVEPVVADRPATRLRVVVENTTPWPDPTAERTEALRRAFIGTHVVLGLSGARFVSLLEPPAWAEAAAAACSNRHTYPVLVGDPQRSQAVLSSPVILYDHPQVAPESPGDFYDATEIDELLTLRTLTLTEAEKAEARATDPRSAAIIDRVDAMTPEALSALHGTFRGEDHLPRRPRRSPPPGAPSPGARVRLRPRRHADAHDLFLVGRTAVVHDTVVDVDGTVFVTVTLDDDPGAELNRWYGRFLFFTPDELEALEGVS